MKRTCNRSASTPTVRRPRQEQSHHQPHCHHPLAGCPCASRGHSAQTGLSAGGMLAALDAMFARQLRPAMHQGQAGRSLEYLVSHPVNAGKHRIHRRNSRQRTGQPRPSPATARFDPTRRRDKAQRPSLRHLHRAFIQPHQNCLRPKHHKAADQNHQNCGCRWPGADTAQCRPRRGIWRIAPQQHRGYRPARHPCTTSKQRRGKQGVVMAQQGAGHFPIPPLRPSAAKGKLSLILSKSCCSTRKIHAARMCGGCCCEIKRSATAAISSL